MIDPVPDLSVRDRGSITHPEWCRADVRFGPAVEVYGLVP